MVEAGAGAPKLYGAIIPAGKTGPEVCPQMAILLLLAQLSNFKTTMIAKFKSARGAMDRCLNWLVLLASAAALKGMILQCNGGRSRTRLALRYGTEACADCLTSRFNAALASLAMLTQSRSHHIVSGGFAASLDLQ